MGEAEGGMDGGEITRKGRECGGQGGTFGVHLMPPLHTFVLHVISRLASQKGVGMTTVAQGSVNLCLSVAV